ncbi:MAG TPA: enoyl-CoA hydratase-related protein [Fimbriimonadaceae bacterium]|nr:enoyl-CoA hydratase-related protein [Fimbriimonadaceae bacterium]
MLMVEAQGPILFVRLNRPDVRNAFNDELIAVLTETFERIDRGVRAVVLAGEGKAFCAGGDLQWMRKASAYTEDENVRDATQLARLFEAIAVCPALTIARVQGAAFGGGCGLVSCVDVAIAEPAALFAFSEVRLGLIPATISRFVIPKIGPGNARWLFATGEAFPAAVAQRIGLVHEVVDTDQLDHAVAVKLEAVLKCGPYAVEQAKRLVLDGPLSIEESARRLAATRASEEAQEGVAAFLDKRQASFVVTP